MQQQLQAISQTANAAVEQLQAQLAEAEQKLKDQEADIQRKDYEAETQRLSAVGKIDPEALKPVVREMVSQMLGQPVVPLMAQHAAADQAMQPAPEPVDAYAAQ
jgi:predicted  nucleic acid-binding Zn-ribbon protein